jgi:hypothetical protein
MPLLVNKEAAVAENTEQTDGRDKSEAIQAVVHSAPVVPAAAGGNKAQDGRYREHPIRQLFPGWKYPSKLGGQDKVYFDRYSNDIQTLKDAAQNYETCGPAVLAASQKIYDDELASRESINTRCSAVLSTGGILGALFVAAAQLGLLQEKGKFGVSAGFLLAAFFIALIYIGFAIAMALAVQGQVKGNVVDPSDIVRAEKSNVNQYDMALAIYLLDYTVKNYGVNNDFKFKLHSAQLCLRNGIIAIIIAGMLSPWTLRTAAAIGSSTLPAPCAYHRTVDTSLAVRRIPADSQIGTLAKACASRLL